MTWQRPGGEWDEQLHQVDLLLDELITRRIGLAELNDAFGALRAGKGARSVLVPD
jgi:Zn-dependent alcohol dehydrogenase